MLELYPLADILAMESGAFGDQRDGDKAVMDWLIAVTDDEQLITENYLLDEVSAAKAFYESKVYALLEDEDTKVWHFSPATLFSMFDEEKKTGRFVIPEEG